jgi:hypothetical protein
LNGEAKFCFEYKGVIANRRGQCHYQTIENKNTIIEYLRVVNMSDKDISLHDQVKNQILLACNSLGFQAKEEYKGKDWRADVFILANGVKHAFEVQITQQSLNRTLERQEKYKRDGIVGCWLFEKDPSRKNEEREDLPLFKVNNNKGQITVSLKDRKTLQLDNFISDYLQGKIKFCQTINTLPKTEIIFVEMKFWKCGAVNHIYYIGPFASPCNTIVHYQEGMWNFDKMVSNPEIMSKAKEYANDNEKRLNLATLKNRYSKTVGKSYLSFGCWKCDSIFGDWFVHEAIIETWYGDGIFDKTSFEVSFDLELRKSIPHWCHPGKNKFCE